MTPPHPPGAAAAIMDAIDRVREAIRAGHAPSAIAMHLLIERAQRQPQMEKRTMTPLEHSDHILATPAGEWLVAIGPVRGVNMGEGGSLVYAEGDRFRVEYASGDVLRCHDENARAVAFFRDRLPALRRERPKLEVVE
jgi:hypothetical protein